jgi:hypothetical protein
MAAVQSGVVSQVIGLLPQRVLRALDGWSHRIAQRRAQERQQLWLAQKAAAETKSIS